MASIRDGENELSILGRKTEYRQDYAPEVLEAYRALKDRTASWT